MLNKLKTCRCCLTEKKQENDLHEFSSEFSLESEKFTKGAQNFVKIGDCFTSLTNIDVPEDLEDQSKICMQCLGDLKAAYMFQVKCLESEKVFSREEFVIDEQDSNLIEYVEEEYIEDANHQTNSIDDEEGTDDGIENVDEEQVKSEVEPEQEVHLQELENFPCHLCQKAFDSKEAYRRHFRRSHMKHIVEESDDAKSGVGSPIELYQCDLCGKISVSLEDHRAHDAEHQGEPRIKCKKCDYKFPSKGEARMHMNTVHSNDDKLFACETCPKSFRNRYQLVLHNRSHTGEKPFVCTICSRAFSMSSNLQKHMDTHSTEKPYGCTVCNQFFKTQRSLKFHTVCFHEPEAKVKCTQCDKSFVNKSYLKMHMLYHTGQKNFTCTICSSKYYKSSHLKRHIQNVHFKLRLMKCEFCESDFVRKETYRSHITSNHKRHLSEKEYAEVLERIRKFQVPKLDINKFTLEKQPDYQDYQVEEESGVEVMVSDLNSYDVGVLEVLEDSQVDNEMDVQGDSEYFEESELYEDEQ